MADNDIVQALEANQHAPKGSAPMLPPLPPDALIIVPVRNIVLFPGIVMPVTIGRTRSIAAAQQAVREQRQVGILMQREAEMADPDADRHASHRHDRQYRALHDRAGRRPPSVCQGDQRFQVTEFLSGWPFFVARVAADSRTGRALARDRGALFTFATSSRGGTRTAAAGAAGIDRGRPVGRDTRGVWPISRPPIWIRSRSEKQEILETIDITARMEKVSQPACPAHRGAAALRRDRQADQGGAWTSGSARSYCASRWPRSRSSSAKARRARPPKWPNSMPRSPRPRCRRRWRTQARKELRRLQRMPDAAAEYGMMRTYLDWLIELPWALPEESPIDIKDARRILDEDHYGLDKIKRRIIEYLAVRKLSPAGQGADPVLRRSARRRQDLARPVDRARHEPQVRAREPWAACTTKPKSAATAGPISARCPATSSRRSARPAARNCVMMLDEIDKLGAGIQGDPGAALLEVLDPEQNNTFRDNYLGVPFDLSRVAFITTANMLDTVPGPLRDRMEIISLPGYTADEKLEIARRYLVQRQLEANGLQPGQVEIDDEALREIIAALHARGGRAQSRTRDRQGAAARGGAHRRGPERPDPHRLPAISRSFSARRSSRTRSPCAPACPAWRRAWPGRRSVATFCSSRRRARRAAAELILTGQLGDVMKESAQAALSIVKSQAAQFGIDAVAFREERHPHPRPGGRHAQGWAERRRRHVHGAGLADD